MQAKLKMLYLSWVNVIQSHHSFKTNCDEKIALKLFFDNFLSVLPESTSMLSGITVDDIFYLYLLKTLRLSEYNL